MKFKDLVDRMKEVVSYDVIVKTFRLQLIEGEMRVTNRQITPEQFLRLSKEEKEDLEIELTIKTILDSTDDLVEWLEEKGISGKELETMKKNLEISNEMIKADIISLPDGKKEGKRRAKGKKRKVTTNEK